MKDEEKKIGILTIPNAENYGSVMQAYAMRVFMKENGIDAEVINYNPEYLKGRYSIFKVNTDKVGGFIKSILSNIVNLPNRYIKRQRFNKFRKKYIEISSDKINNMDEINLYDAIIVGGDQLWNTRITKYNKLFFLKNCMCKKKIAFSVSFGYSNRNSEENDFYKKYINNFDSVYVRETYDVSYISKIFKGNRYNYVLDPTMLIDSKLWNECCRERIIREKYVLVYCFNNDEKVFETACNIRDQLGLPIYIISSSYRKKNKKGFYNISGVGPREFLTLIRDAEVIITNSFHGTVFSIIFKKKFCCIPYEGTEGRMTSLLKLLGLEEALEMKVNKLKYNKTDRIIQKEREKANLIIRKEIGDE